MPNPTTVNLTDRAQPLKEELAPIFGLRNVLSAGLLLFSRLSAAEQRRIVAEVNDIEIADPSEGAAESVRYSIKRMQALDDRDLAVAFQFLSKEENRAVKQMLDALAPEKRAASRKRKRKARSA